MRPAVLLAALALGAGNSKLPPVPPGANQQKDAKGGSADKDLEAMTGDAKAASPKPDGGAAPDAGHPDAGSPGKPDAGPAKAGAVDLKSDALPPLPSGPYVPYKMQVERLPNGLTVMLIPYQANGLVAYDTVMRVGSRNEVEAKRTGYAHFFEHMMFKGTKKVPEDKYGATLRGLGIDSNAFTSDDITLYHNLGAASALPQLVELEADRFQNLTYAKEVFETEAKAVLGEYNKNASRPELRLEESLAKTAFTAHTYRHTTLGFLEDIKAMPQGFDYSKQFFKKYYTPDNAIVVVAGDFKPDEVLGQIKQHYGAWKGKAADPKPKAEPPQSSERTATVDWPTPTLPRLILAYHTPQDDPKSKDAATVMLLGPLLTGPTSALYKDLVLGRQLVDHMEIWSGNHRDPNLFTVVIVAKKESDLPEIQKAFDAAVKELLDGKVDEKYLQALKLNQLYDALSSLETPGQVAMQLGMEAGITGDPEGFEKLYANLAQTSVQDVVGFAQLYLLPEGRTVVTLKSKGGAK